MSDMHAPSKPTGKAKSSTFIAATPPCARRRLTPSCAAHSTHRKLGRPIPSFMAKVHSHTACQATRQPDRRRITNLRSGRQPTQQDGRRTAIAVESGCCSSTHHPIAAALQPKRAACASDQFHGSSVRTVDGPFVSNWLPTGERATRGMVRPQCIGCRTASSGAATSGATTSGAATSGAATSGATPRNGATSRRGYLNSTLSVLLQ